MQLIKSIDKSKLPKHIAIIMDGNGRWAKQRGEERVFGHENGVEAVRSVIEGSGECGIQYLTLYAFSTENWNRPKEEVEALMFLLVNTIHAELDRLMENKVRLLAIGDIPSLAPECRKELQNAIENTKDNTGLTVILALSYSARWELVEMVKKIVGANIPAASISDQVVAQNLSTAGIPDPDILIRTGGEYRISNFLLWQIAYTELFFPSKMWPDFRKEDLWQIIIDYQSRERRFGKTSDQLLFH